MGFWKRGIVRAALRCGRLGAGERREEGMGMGVERGFGESLGWTLLGNAVSAAAARGCGSGGHWTGLDKVRCRAAAAGMGRCGGKESFLRLHLLKGTAATAFQ